MSPTTLLLNTWIAATLFFQIGTVPIWVPLAIILIIILIFWWGLTRNNIPEEGTPAEEQEIVHAEADAPEDSTTLPDATEEAEEATDPAPTDAVEEVVDEAVDDAPETPKSPPAADDLKIIEGVGPKIASILAAAGITTYDQLAGTSVADLEKIVREDAGIKVAYPASWPAQAASAAAGDWDGLEDLQKKLVAGRHRD